jgi:hypothetical protein
VLFSLNMVDKLPKPLVHLAEINRLAQISGAQFLFSDPFSWSKEVARPTSGTDAYRRSHKFSGLSRDGNKRQTGAGRSGFFLHEKQPGPLDRNSHLARESRLFNSSKLSPGIFFKRIEKIHKLGDSSNQAINKEATPVPRLPARPQVRPVLLNGMRLGEV